MIEVRRCGIFDQMEVFHPSDRGLAFDESYIGGFSYLYNTAGFFCSVPYKGTLEVSWAEDLEEKVE